MVGIPTMADRSLVNSAMLFLFPPDSAWVS